MDIHVSNGVVWSIIGAVVTAIGTGMWWTIRKVFGLESQTLAINAKIDKEVALLAAELERARSDFLKEHDQNREFYRDMRQSHEATIQSLVDNINRCNE